MSQVRPHALASLDRLLRGGTLGGLSDRELLDRFLTARDEVAFELLMARHGGMVHAVALQTLADRSAAEDVFQAVFLVLVNKAETIRGDSAASWLYRITRRIARQANLDEQRRNRREERACAERLAHERPDLDPELVRFVHGEVDRLPEKHRHPITLCYLESLTYNEAAERLHWTSAQVRKRLEQARKVLKRRLGRYLAAPAAAIELLEAQRGKAAAVPPEPARRALVAAMHVAAGGKAAEALVSGAVARLARLGLGISAPAHLKAAVVAAACLAVVGGSVAASGRPRIQDKGQPAAMEKPGARRALVGPIAPVNVQGTIALEGVVLTPDGKPCADAEVIGYYEYAIGDMGPRFPTVRCKSDAKGAFKLRIADSGSVDEAIQNGPILGASRRGFAPTWKTLWPKTAGGIELKLRPDAPIRGRFLDLEGTPIAGVKVSILEAMETPDGNLDSWMARVAKADQLRGAAFLNGLQSLEPSRFSETPAIVSDQAGRVELNGAGAERILRLRIEGAGIVATDQLYAVSRPMKIVSPTNHETYGGARYWSLLVGAGFDLPCSPTRTLFGVVSDKQTGKPVANARVISYGFGGQRFRGQGVASAVCDGQGRYELVGMPAEPGNLIRVLGPESEPYPSRIIESPNASGIEPVRLDMTITKGVWIEGKVSELESGKPLPRVQVLCLPFQDNPRLADYPGLRLSETGEMAVRTDRTGAYRVIALQGSSLLAALDREHGEDYILGFGADKIRRRGVKKTLGTIEIGIMPDDYQSFLEVNGGAAGEIIRSNLALSRGLSRMVKVLDVTGAPVKRPDVLLFGSYQGLNKYIAPESETFRVNALDPAHPRYVIVQRIETAESRALLVRGDEPEPVELRLRKSGYIKGRLVDAGGEPLPGRRVTWTAYLPGESRYINALANRAQESAFAVTDADGAFMTKPLVPGLDWSIVVWTPKQDRGLERSKHLLIEPGRVVDLGDIKVIDPLR